MTTHCVKVKAINRKTGKEEEYFLDLLKDMSEELEARGAFGPHCLRGPAVGNVLFYIGGERYYSEVSFEEQVRRLQSLSLAEKLTDPRWWVRTLI